MYLDKKTKVAVVVSHPIQHFCPQYCSWAKINNLDLKVFFASTHGVEAYHDKNFGKVIKWNAIKLDFPHVFMEGAQGKEVGNQIQSSDLEKNLDEFKPDYLISYGYAQKLQKQASAWAKKNAIKILMISDSEHRQHRNIIKKIVKKVYLPTVYSAITGFLTVGDANEAYYKSYGVTDKKLFRNFFPIDIESYDAMYINKQEIRKSLRSLLGINEDSFVLLMVGKQVPWKRQSDLVELSNRMQRNKLNVTIVLAGTGPDMENNMASAHKIGSGGVIFAGFVAPEKLIEYYLAADAYVHCSAVEPHSLAISEAIYCGLPAIISDKCGSFGPSDDVRIGLNGFVYESGNIDELYKAVIALYSDSGMYKSMSEYSRKIAVNNQNLAHGVGLCQAIVATGLSVRQA